MNIELRYFASVREALGAGGTIEVDAGSTVGSVRAALIARDAAHADALARHRALRCALNRALCDESAPVVAGDEIAFFPPLTGG